MIMDYGRLLLHKPVKEIMDNFKRYRFNANPELNLKDDKDFWNAYALGNKWENYSFLPSEEVKARLSTYGVVGVQEEKLSLEDAFIGLTGKY